jgi:hypothetical protein
MALPLLAYSLALPVASFAHFYTRLPGLAAIMGNVQSPALIQTAQAQTKDPSLSDTPTINSNHNTAKTPNHGRSNSFSNDLNRCLKDPLLCLKINFD